MNAEGILSREEWLSAVQKRLGTTDCEVLAVSGGLIEGEIGGFLGDHLQMKVTVKVHGETKQLPFFLKTMPRKHQLHTDFTTSSQGFPKEGGLYTKVFNNFPKTEEPWGPQCYFARPDSIVMEDLSQDHFQLVGRRKYLDFSHCAVTLRALARFHAASIVYEEQQSLAKGKPCKLGELYSDVLFENLYINDNNSQLNIWFVSSVETLAASVDLLKKYKNNSSVSNLNIQKFREYCYQVYEDVKPSKKFKNTIGHGDMWPNNVLYKYDDNEERNPIAARLVDYQISRYCPPALDVMYFLHLSTTRDFRRANKYKLLSIYYDSLKEELARHGYKVEELLPWSEFEESCRYFSHLACVISPCYFQMNTIPENIMEELLNGPDAFQFFVNERPELVARCCEEDMFYRNRMLNALEELVERVLEYQNSSKHESCSSCCHNDPMSFPKELVNEA